MKSDHISISKGSADCEAYGALPRHLRHVDLHPPDYPLSEYHKGGERDQISSLDLHLVRFDCNRSLRMM